MVQSHLPLAFLPQRRVGVEGRSLRILLTSTFLHPLFSQSTLHTSAPGTPKVQTQQCQCSVSVSLTPSCPEDQGLVFFLVFNIFINLARIDFSALSLSLSMYMSPHQFLNYSINFHTFMHLLMTLCSLLTVTKYLMPSQALGTVPNAL